MRTLTVSRSLQPAQGWAQYSFECKFHSQPDAIERFMGDSYRGQAIAVLRAVCAALALVVPEASSAGEDATAIAPGQSDSPATSFHLEALSLNVYGLSYHPDRETAHRTHLDNEFNPGLGLHYELDNSERGVTFAEVGSYRDSGRNWAKFAGLGYQFKVGAGWRLGGAVAAFQSRTYNDGAAFVGVAPLVTYDFGPVQLNAVYFPKFGNYNVESAFGFYVTLPVGKWVR